MNALVFLYKRVLKIPLDGKINGVRATRKVNVPVVMTREEVAHIITLMEGTPQLVVKLLYGSGLRILEALRLRVQDIDYEFKQLTVRSGKGAKDRVTPFPSSAIPLFQNHLSRVKVIHEPDLDQGYGEVYMPYALLAQGGKGFILGGKVKNIIAFSVNVNPFARCFSFLKPLLFD